ncbi:MAG: ABC-F family ATP-binding cassette domain-containing protein [Bacteroidales bacterium]
MNYFSAENLSKSFGDQFLFEGLSFGLSRGDKVALVARNGAGKTTLLRILMGKMDPDTGEYTFRSGLKSAFLEQAPDLDGSLTIDQLIATTNTPVLAVIRSYEKALDNHAKHQNSASDKNLQLATNKMDQVDAWDYERRLKQLLDLFRVSNTTQKVSELSGGEKKRLALAMILLDKPDILILDEPTNHLDIQMIEWLEQYLSQTALTLLMVTHDRYFLDRVCNRIIEISLGKMYQYHGNYGLFLQKRAEREEITRVESVKAGQLMKKELAWLNRMPKARTGKSKARIDAFDGIKERANMLTDEGELTLRVKSPRLGTKILEIDNVSKAYGSTKILDHFSYKFAKGERLGIIGRNGTGKTAFLDVISGVAGKDQGTIERGKTLEIGYYRQMGMEWRDDQRVIDAVKDIAEVVSIEDGKTISASRFLEHFMFTPEAQYKMISKLSGGELRRLHLLTVLIKNPNFLILDEPTNDLDLFALNRLEEFLLSFKGCLVIVSHDRYFLDKLTDHIFIFEGGGEIKDHYGTYSSYRPSRGRVEIKDNTGKNRNADRRKKPAIKTKLTFSEQQEYEQLEADIEELENEKSSLEAELSTRGLPYEILEEKSKRAAEIIDLIESKLNRWMDLGQYVKD